MWDRLLCAIDQFVRPGGSGLCRGRGLGQPSQRQGSAHPGTLENGTLLRLETPSEAEDLVREAVRALGSSGVAAEGRSCSELENRRRSELLDEAPRRDCQAVVLHPGVFMGLAGSPVVA